MPVPIKPEKFTVDSYDVSVSQATDKLRRVITLTSLNLSHGIRFKTTLFFFKANFTSPSVGHANNLGGTNFNLHSDTARNGTTLFSNFYAVLSTGSPVPVKFTYDIASTSENQKDVTSYRLFSGNGDTRRR